MINKNVHFTQQSQVEPSEFVKKLIADFLIGNIETPEDLLKLRKILPKVLKERPYNAETQAAEKEIRWKRSGSQIMEDGYVYATKSCTDIVIAYLTLVAVAGIQDFRFVKVKNPETKVLHSLAEIKLPDGWYRYDVSLGRAVPEKGEILAGEPIFFNGEQMPYLLWKKGKDSWSLGLDNYISGLDVQV
jgi:hypothetical protein